MTQGIKDLVSSAHGILAIALIAAATTLAAIGTLSTDQWLSYTQWIFGIAAGSHAVITAADSLSSRGSNPVQDAIKAVSSSTAPAASASVTATVTKETTSA